MTYENVIIRDDRGIDSHMVRFRMETNRELFGGEVKIHPAFIIDGRDYDDIYIGKYPATIIDGRAYSLPYTDVTTDILFEDARKACTQKGPGWHMMTAAEWGLVALHSLRLNTLPYGNTYDGIYYGAFGETGIRYKCASPSFAFTLTGSGPRTWSHNHREDGVYDLCGNADEMICGLRLI